MAQAPKTQQKRIAQRSVAVRGRLRKGGAVRAVTG
jgi:hypothetical protein